MATNNAVNTTLSGQTGTGNFAGSTSPSFVTPVLGTPTSGTLTNCTGLPISTGVSGLGTGIATWLGTPSSANLLSAMTTSTGSGNLVFATSPTFVTPVLGTPTSGTLTNCTGLPISTGVSGLGTGVATFLGTPSSTNLRTALTDPTGTGSNVFATSPTLVTPILGTPTSGTLTNCTGLPVSTGISGLGTGVATALAAAVTGSGGIVLATSATLTTPTIGAATASSLTFSSTSGIIGSTTNDSAAAGSVGEYVTATLASGSAITLTSGTSANITSISLTGGDWDVWGNIWWTLSGTGSQIKAAVSTSSGNLPASTGGLGFMQIATSFTTGFTNGAPVGVTRLSLSSTTTVFLVINASFTVGATGFGTIAARRVR